MIDVIKILVLDHNEPDLEVLIRQIFRKKILSTEINFFFAHTEEEALNLIIKDSKIKILITDGKIHTEGHEDLLIKVSKMKRLIKSVVITPYGDIESIRTAMNKGAFDFVTRPINLKELELTIYKTIDNLHRQQEVEKDQTRLIDIEKELNVAKTIQDSIIPHQFNPLPKHQTFEIYGSMLPAKTVGGDFFDFFPLDDHLLAFIIADVSGKGVPAALFMTMTRGLIRALSQKNRSPLECLQELNELISLENESAMFVTAFYGILNVMTGDLQFCNAGHNPPYLITPRGELKQIARCEGVALGVEINDNNYKQNSLTLNPGDILLLYTDGVIDARNNEGLMFQEARLESFLKTHNKDPLHDMVNGVVAEVNRFSLGNEQSDDITLLAIKYLGISC